MRAFVFTDRSLARQAGRFVWLELDTERSKNAAVRKRLQIAALPTFFVLDPKDERVALRWVGGATLPQLDKMLDDGRAAVVASATPSKGRPVNATQASRADESFAMAERFYGASDNVHAAEAYQRALAQAPARWSHEARAVESLLFALTSIDSNLTAAQIAREAYPRLSRTPSAANVAGSGLDAAIAVPADHPMRKALIDSLVADCRQVVQDRSLPIAADDRSGVFIALLDERQDAKDDAGAKQVAGEWATFLEGEAARARTPEQRAVFDPHRLSAYLELDEPERAVPMLEASERDFPADYNPPARLATAYKAMKRWDDALAASDRALAKAYGPRRLGMLQTRADIYVGRGDVAGARRTLQDALAEAEALPGGQRSETTIANLKKKIDALPKP